MTSTEVRCAEVRGHNSRVAESLWRAYDYMRRRWQHRRVAGPDGVRFVVQKTLRFDVDRTVG